MGTNQKIAGVVVTYNRKQLLKRCLGALSCQEQKPDVVYIIDNASTDGTRESVKEWGYYEQVVSGISFKYVLNSKNEGGAGGFYLGIKTAYESGADAIWVMDDDGQPNTNCLKGLSVYLEEYDYIAPIVLSDVDHQSCSFAPNFEKREKYIIVKGVKNGIIDNWASPFNGILYSRKLVEKIGYPKKEMFIWGDEQNYHLRAINAGMKPITVVDAIHYHPLDRQEKIEYKGYRLTIANSHWKQYCVLRNSWYNRIHLYKDHVKGCFASLNLLYLYYSYFKHVRKENILSLLIDAYISALFGCFDGLEKYMK